MIPGRTETMNTMGIAVINPSRCKEAFSGYEIKWRDQKFKVPIIVF